MMTRMKVLMVVLVVILTLKNFQYFHEIILIFNTVLVLYLYLYFIYLPRR